MHKSLYKANKQWRSQVTDDAWALHVFVFLVGVACYPRNFCILEVATQIVLETTLELSSVLNREYFLKEVFL